MGLIFKELPERKPEGKQCCYAPAQSVTPTHHYTPQIATALGSTGTQGDQKGLP